MLFLHYMLVLNHLIKIQDSRFKLYADFEPPDQISVRMRNSFCCWEYSILGVVLFLENPPRMRQSQTLWLHWGLTWSRWDGTAQRMLEPSILVRMTPRQSLRLQRTSCLRPVAHRVSPWLQTCHSRYSDSNRQWPSVDRLCRSWDSRFEIQDSSYMLCQWLSVDRLCRSWD